MDTASTSRKLPPAEKLVEINGPYWNLFQAMLNLADTCEVYEWATTRACGSATNGWIKFHDSMETGPSKDYSMGLLGAGKGKISDQKTRLVNIWTKAAQALASFRSNSPDQAPPPPLVQADKQLTKFNQTVKKIAARNHEKKRVSENLDEVELDLGLQPPGAASAAARLQHSVNLTIGAEPDAGSLLMTREGGKDDPIAFEDDDDISTSKYSTCCVLLCFKEHSCRNE